MVTSQVGRFGLPAAFSALSFLLSGGPDKLGRQFDTDPENDPALMEWLHTLGATALPLATIEGVNFPEPVKFLNTTPGIAAGNFVLSGGLGQLGRLATVGNPEDDPSFSELAGTAMSTALPFGVARAGRYWNELPADNPIKARANTALADVVKQVEGRAAQVRPTVEDWVKQFYDRLGIKPGQPGTFTPPTDAPAGAGVKSTPPQPQGGAPGGAAAKPAEAVARRTPGTLSAAETAVITALKNDKDAQQAFLDLVYKSPTELTPKQIQDWSDAWTAAHSGAPAAASPEPSPTVTPTSEPSPAQVVPAQPAGAEVAAIPEPYVRRLKYQDAQEGHKASQAALAEINKQRIAEGKTPIPEPMFVRPPGRRGNLQYQPWNTEKHRVVHNQYQQALDDWLEKKPESWVAHVEGWGKRQEQSKHPDYGGNIEAVNARPEPPVTVSNINDQAPASGATATETEVAGPVGKGYATDQSDPNYIPNIITTLSTNAGTYLDAVGKNAPIARGPSTALMPQIRSAIKQVVDSGEDLGAQGATGAKLMEAVKANWDVDGLRAKVTGKPPMGADRLLPAPEDFVLDLILYDVLTPKTAPQILGYGNFRQIVEGLRSQQVKRVGGQGLINKVTAIQDWLENPNGPAPTPYRAEGVEAESRRDPTNKNLLHNVRATGFDLSEDLSSNPNWMIPPEPITGDNYLRWLNAHSASNEPQVEGNVTLPSRRAGAIERILRENAEYDPAKVTSGRRVNKHAWPGPGDWLIKLFRQWDAQRRQLLEEQMLEAAKKAQQQGLTQGTLL